MVVRQKHFYALQRRKLLKMNKKTIQINFEMFKESN